MKPARLWHALLAALAIAGLTIELCVTIARDPAAWPHRLLIYFSFFTILTNMLVAAASLGSARKRGRLHRWAHRPAPRAAISVYIAVVAVIYQLLLARLIHLSPIGWWGNLLVHQIVPAMWLTGWVLFGRHGGIARTAPLHWLAYPAVYAIWTLSHGAASGWYPYPFMNVATRGGAAVAINMLSMSLFFAVLGYAFRWIDAVLGRRLTRIAPKA
ncbi:MAG TPA: Pr6Pr family membrane protein [Sphingomonas sp.]|nr:Pr6Pr family membrane protein [Sphingomonas sp.]